MTVISRMVLAAVIVLAAEAAPAQKQATPTLSQYVWDLDAIYPTAEDWNRERNAIETGLLRIDALKLQPVKSPSDLARLLTAVSDVRGRAGRMAKVGLLQHAVDTRSEEARRRQEEGQTLERRAEGAVAFVEPLIRSLDREILAGWLRDDPQLTRHERRIARTLSLAPYAPAPGFERVTSNLSLIAALASDTYGEVVNADLAWPPAPGTGAKGKLDLPAYFRLKKSSDVQLRNQAAERFLGHLDGYRELFGTLLTRRISGDLLVARHRNLDDPIDLLLVVNDGLDPQSHRAMFAASRAARAEVARAAKVLARMHGVERLTYTDLFVPVHPPGGRYPVKAAIDAIVAATAPLGEAYQRLLWQRFDENWMHLPSAPGKSGTVGVFWQVGGGHPHVILSYADDYESARTLAGAAMLMMGYASVPADQAPDRREEDFPVFSNALWMLGPLMFDRVALEQELSTRERAGILSAQLTWLLRSYVRNTAIAELESVLADKAAIGQSVSGTEISTLYLSLLREYFGDAVVIADYQANEWMTHGTLFYGPHYASFAAATAVAVALDEGIATGDPNAVAAARDGIARSRTHLSGDVLKNAGIDLATLASHEPVARRIATVTSELTRLLDALER